MADFAKSQKLTRPAKSARKMVNPPGPGQMRHGPKSSYQPLWRTKGTAIV